MKTKKTHFKDFLSFSFGLLIGLGCMYLYICMYIHLSSLQNQYNAIWVEVFRGSPGLTQQKKTLLWGGVARFFSWFPVCFLEAPV